MRNVFRASFPDPFSVCSSMFKIYSNSYGLGHTCPPDCTVRSVWRAPPFNSVEPLAAPLWQLGPPRAPMAARKLRDDPAERPLGLPKSPRDALQTLLRYASACIQTSRRVSFVGESAMHMKWPDSIGREAGIGKTRNWKDLSVFRACPW